MKEVFAIVASLLAVIGNVPYMRDMLRRKIQPHPYTWFVWSIVSGVTLAGQIAKGAGVGAIPVATSEVFTILIFLLSLRYGFKGIPRKDTYFLIAALCGLIPWALTRDPTFSVMTVVTIDVVAFIPTLRKTWLQPTTEKPLLYAMNVLRHILILFSLEAYNVATTLHSIAMLVANTAMTMFILRHKKTGLRSSS